MRNITDVGWMVIVGLIIIFVWSMGNANHAVDQCQRYQTSYYCDRHD